ncbi:MAG: hypothetical protein NZZ41_01655, partial [Candidatus Dojkabacteria bacterium]|nr:hypothetical protein [Candidatus Dojkabacteria bacterium]
MTIFNDDKLLKIKNNYEKYYNNFNERKISKEQKLIYEAKILFPHLTPSFILHNKKLLHTVIESYKKSKKQSFLLTESSQKERRKYIKESVLLDINLFALKESEDHIDYLLKLCSYKNKLFHPVVRKNALFEAETATETGTQQKTGSNVTRFNFEDFMYEELDPNDPDDQNPHNVAYWERIAREEPNAPDLKVYLAYRKFYKAGYSVPLIYGTIPEDEPGGGRGDKTSHSPKIQKMLYDRYKLKKSLLRHYSGDQETINAQLKAFDEKHNLAQVIKNLGYDLEYESNTEKNQLNQLAGTTSSEVSADETGAKQPKGDKKGLTWGGIFKGAVGAIGRATKAAAKGVYGAAKGMAKTVAAGLTNVGLFVLRRVFGNNPEAKEALEQLEGFKKQLNTEVVGFWKKVVKAIASIPGSVWTALKFIGKTGLTTSILWYVAEVIATMILPPIGLIIFLCIKIIALTYSTFKQIKTIKEIIESNKKDNEKGFIGFLKALIRTFDIRKPENAFKLIMAALCIVTIIFNVLQIRAAAQKLADQVRLLLQSWNVPPQVAQQVVQDAQNGKIDEAAKKATENSSVKDATQKAAQDTAQQQAAQQTAQQATEKTAQAAQQTAQQAT